MEALCDQLIKENIKQQKEIDELKIKVQALENKLVKDNLVVNRREEGKINILLIKYKKSIIISDKDENQNVTYKYKEIFKEYGAKWFKNEQYKGWILPGILKDNEDMLEIFRVIKERIEELSKLEIEITLG